jgi:predicted Fe-Mo cluster-binding NifX family protein
VRIAVASQNFRTVTGHAGKTRRFFVFDAEPGTAPREVDRLDLATDMSIHEFQGDGPHPLYAMKVVIAGSAGPGFVRRLAEHGVTVVATSETDPASAVSGFLAGTLPAAAPHDHGAGGDAHDHGDEAEHCGCGCI